MDSKIQVSLFAYLLQMLLLVLRQLQFAVKLIDNNRNHSVVTQMLIGRRLSLNSSSWLQQSYLIMPIYFRGCELHVYALRSGCWYCCFVTCADLLSRKVKM